MFPIFTILTLSLLAFSSAKPIPTGSGHTNDLNTLNHHTRTKSPHLVQPDAESLSGVQSRSWFSSSKKTKDPTYLSFGDCTNSANLLRHPVTGEVCALMGGVGFKRDRDPELCLNGAQMAVLQEMGVCWLSAPYVDPKAQPPPARAAAQAPPKAGVRPQNPTGPRKKL
ncbi:hypothetical protein D9615_010314 [Tricholomella constricta]|uniref:Uncharacterized protein n=1 Tax=Tricholomella constricta TaxID=117010 RepID=A0A8H5GPP9_9AGAR|nr:hypothetical protein D9615_010314 [Tricholomella constricta]